MNRYNYNSSRRRNYGSQSNTTNGASSIVTLMFLLIVMIAWILSLKADVSNISDRNFELKKQNDSLVNRIDFLTKKPEPIVVEEKHKKVTQGSGQSKHTGTKVAIKDTTSVNTSVKKVETKVETDTTKI